MCSVFGPVHKERQVLCRNMVIIDSEKNFHTMSLAHFDKNKGCFIKSDKNVQQKVIFYDLYCLI